MHAYYCFRLYLQYNLLLLLAICMSLYNNLYKYFEYFPSSARCDKKCYDSKLCTLTISTICMYVFVALYCVSRLPWFKAKWVKTLANLDTFYVTNYVLLMTKWIYCQDNNQGSSKLNNYSVNNPIMFPCT